MRVALLPGCAQQVLAPEINEATIRLLTRHGCEVVVARGAGCCGAPRPSHGPRGALGFATRQHRCLDARDRRAAGSTPSSSTPRAAARRSRITASCCATDPAYAEKAAQISALATRCERVDGRARRSSAGDRDRAARRLSLRLLAAARPEACTRAPKALLAAAGFSVVEVPEAHLCCGSAGTYNMLQPELAGRLRDRKVANIESTAPDIVAAGNIGCITQIAGGTVFPWCTRSNCSTGRPAAQCRRHCRATARAPSNPPPDPPLKGRERMRWAHRAVESSPPPEGEGQGGAASAESFCAQCSLESALPRRQFRHHDRQAQHGEADERRR